MTKQVQQLDHVIIRFAHHTSWGRDLRPGDLLSCGTISAPIREEYGSLLQITHGGSEPITLRAGETRTFLQDGDEIILPARTWWSGATRVGFGACRAVVRPALRAAL